MSRLHYKETPTLGEKKALAPYLSEDEQLILVTGLGAAYTRSRFIMHLLFPGLLFLALGFGFGWFFQLDRVLALGIGMVLMILAAALKTLHVYHSNRYLFTTRRVIIKHGFFNVKLTAALFDKITHIEVDQSFFDRLFFHHGDIIINTAGLNKGELILKYVDWPMELKNLLERLINRERESLGQRYGSMTAMEGEIVE